MATRTVASSLLRLLRKLGLGIGAKPAPGVIGERRPRIARTLRLSLAKCLKHRTKQISFQPACHMRGDIGLLLPPSAPCRLPSREERLAHSQRKVKLLRKTSEAVDSLVLMLRQKLKCRLLLPAAEAIRGASARPHRRPDFASTPREGNRTRQRPAHSSLNGR